MLTRGLTAAMAAMLVVVVGGGGGGKKKDGKVTMCGVGDISTAVARFGNSQAPIVN